MKHGASMQLRGTGEHDAVKHREALWQRWRAEIMRESGNRGSLASAESRALHDPEVRRDPQLLSRIQAYVAECRAQLVHERDGHPAPVAPTAVVAHDSATADQMPKEVVDRLEREFQYHIAHFNEAEARAVLERIRQTKRHSHAEQLSRMVLRRDRYERMIRALTDKARKASAEGNADEAARVLRRLSSIHSAHPQILDDVRFAKIRDEIIGASEEHEHRVAARHLVAKERAVAEEIKHLAASVHRFHKVARAIPHDREEYRRAEKEYHAIAGEVKSHDEEWMAGLILELADLLADWDEPPPAAQHQVDKFLLSVRSALAHIKTEMRQIEQEG